MSKDLKKTRARITDVCEKSIAGPPGGRVGDKPEVLARKADVATAE